MRKRFLILFLLVSAVVYGQTPAGYIKANMRFKWTAGIFDSALHVPQYNGTPSGIRNGAWVGDGAIGMDTTNHRMYIYSGGAWLRLAKYSEVTTHTWSLTGNSINAGTDFIGTTNNTSMRFRTNNTVRMVLDSNGNVGIGTTAPAAKFEVNGSNVNNVIFDSINLIVKGNTSGLAIGSYSQPVMFFYPKKWAFRAGFANSGYWDDANIGIGTAAFGHNTKASGSYSLVAGDGNISTGGNNAVFGVSNTVSYDNSIVAGTTNTVSGYAASSFGSVSTVDGYYGHTLGYGLINKDYGSTVVGWMNDTTSHGANTTGSGGIVPNPQNRIFVVGNGTGSYGGARSNALTVLMSGNVGIGTSSPDSLLTVELGIRGKRGARFDGLPTFSDTTNYKPVVINSSGTLYKATYWPGGGGGGGWSLTGNAGTNPASNFIGTTDGQPLMFRYNNQNAGSIGKEGMHTYLGIGAGENDVSGGDPNIGIGYYALGSNTTGEGNSAVGGYVLNSNTTGYYNSAVGVSALYSNTTGSNNSAVGHSAGWDSKQKPDAKYQNLFGANTYGTRDSITVIGANFIKETIVRGKLIDSTLSAGAGTKAVRWNSSTGEFTYADTTANQGTDVASANNLAVVANSTEITGTTQVNLIANTGWVNGAEINLLLANGITIKNGQTTSGSNITILLDGAADFVTASASMLTLVLSEVGGTQAWREKSRRSY